MLEATDKIVVLYLSRYTLFKYNLQTNRFYNIRILYYIHIYIYIYIYRLFYCYGITPTNDPRRAI